jgi:hypothetical protein
MHACSWQVLALAGSWQIQACRFKRFSNACHPGVTSVSAVGAGCCLEINACQVSGGSTFAVVFVVKDKAKLASREITGP